MAQRGVFGSLISVAREINLRVIYNVVSGGCLGIKGNILLIALIRVA